MIIIAQKWRETHVGWYKLLVSVFSLLSNYKQSDTNLRFCLKRTINLMETIFVMYTYNTMCPVSIAFIWMWKNGFKILSLISRQFLDGGENGVEFYLRRWEALWSLGLRIRSTRPSRPWKRSIETLVIHM